MAGGSWGIGAHRAKKHIYYKTLCLCGGETILTKRQYLNQNRYKCSQCRKLVEIDALSSEKVLW